MTSILLPSRLVSQPSGAVRIDRANPLARGLMVAYPQLSLNAVDAGGIAPIAGVMNPDWYSNAVSPIGAGVGGNASSIAAAKGPFVAAGKIPYYGLAEFSCLAVVTLSSLPNYEAAIFRATSSADASGIAFDLLPSRVLRPLIMTSGNSGWSTAYDETDSNIVANTPWIFGFSYKSGSRIVISGPLGSVPRSFSRTSITGVVSDSGGSSGAMYFGGMSYAGTITQVFPGIIHSLAFYRRALSTEDLKSLAINPWQIYEPTKRRIWFDMGAASGGSAVLEGAASGATSASGALTTGIPIAGAALSVAGASGALSVGIPLAGAAVSQATAQSTLVTAIQLLGSAAAQASASGSLNAGVLLAGVANTQASASSTLTAQIKLSAQALAQTAASGQLAGGSAQLAALAQAVASGGGMLTTSIKLSAQALTQTIAAGSLITQISLASATNVLASGGGGLTAQIRLGGWASALANAGGELMTAPSGLSGAAQGVASLNANPFTQIQLSAYAFAQASTSGSLMGGSEQSMGAMPPAVWVYKTQACATSRLGDSNVWVR